MRLLKVPFCWQNNEKGAELLPAGALSVRRPCERLTSAAWGRDGEEEGRRSRRWTCFTARLPARSPSLSLRLTWPSDVIFPPSQQQHHEPLTFGLFNADCFMQGSPRREGRVREEKRGEEQPGWRATSLQQFVFFIFFFYLHNTPCSTIKMNFGWGWLFLNHCLQGHIDWSVHMLTDGSDAAQLVTYEKLSGTTGTTERFRCPTACWLVLFQCFVLFCFFADSSHEIFMGQLWGAANRGCRWDRWQPVIGAHVPWYSLSALVCGQRWCTYTQLYCRVVLCCLWS